MHVLKREDPESLCGLNAKHPQRRSINFWYVSNQRGVVTTLHVDSQL